jgi:hypothetical protein
MPSLGDGLAKCQSCDAELLEGQGFCPRCGRKASNSLEDRPDASITVLMMAGVGGLLAFFGLSFGLVAAIAEPGFLTVALMTCGIALALFVLAYFSRRRQLNEWKAHQASLNLLAKCSYCGLQNDVGSKRCESCGGPLGP